MFTNRRTTVAAVLFGALVVIAATAGAVLLRPASSAQASSVIELNNPLQQDDVSPDMALQLDAIQNEAGISAWFNAGAAVDLNTVADNYRTIEAHTANYIIGSVAVPDYDERHDVHMYIHKDGWFLAYYLRADSVAKMVDIEHYPAEGIRSKFEVVLGEFADHAGVPFQPPKFWDFRYPNANRIMMVAEGEDGGNSFTVKLPTAYLFFERSFALDDGGRFILDGVVVGDCWDPCEGNLTTTQLAADAVHTVVIGDQDFNQTAVGALILTYRQP